MANNIPWQKERLRDFTGGENLKILPEFIQPNQVVKAQNCVITNYGNLETRQGKTLLNPTSLGDGAIISLHRWATEDGTRYITAQHGTSLYSVAWNGSDDIVFPAAVKTGLSSDKLRSVVWKGKLILTNGSDQPFTFDGTTCADLTNAPKSKIIALYANRIWMVDVDTGFIENSNLEDPTTWTDSGSYKVRDGEGDGITCLQPLSGGMVIFKQNSIQTLYGTSRTNIAISEPFSARIGCASPDGVLPDGLFFGNDNFYTYSLNSISPMPETHTPLIEAMTPAERAATVAIAHPITRRGIVILGTADDLYLCVHGKYQGAITTWSGMDVGCMAVADCRNDSGDLLLGSASAGQIFRYEGDTDNGTAISTRIKTAYYDHNIFDLKEWASFIPEIEILAENTTYSMYYNFDIDYNVFGGMYSSDFINNILDWGIDAWGDSYWGTESRITDPFYMHTARGNRISFDIINDTRMSFNGFTTRFRKVGAQR